MNITSPTPPTRFSKDNTFEYIAQVLARNDFEHIVPTLSENVHTILFDPNQLARDVGEQIQMLQKAHPEDTYYLGEYLQAFRYDTRFRTYVLQKVTQEYQAQFNALVAQK